MTDLRTTIEKQQTEFAHELIQDDALSFGAKQRIAASTAAILTAVERYVVELAGEAEPVPPPLGVPSYPGAVEANMYAQEWVRGRNVLRAELIAKLNKEHHDSEA